ncbi:MAG: ADP-glyceromanno-heptose 6-epimerase [Ignavibacteria bacterium]|nr:ADP-glyceromanno-heptose 6-epimerase [Ignavibacteria bacterium]
MILLTGGAGFIGSTFLKLLNDNGIKDIIIVDRIGKTSKWKNLIGKRFYDFYHKDQFLQLFETKKFTNLRFDVIFHFGACTDTTETNMDYLLENNFKYSVKLAQFAAEKDIRFIYASSAATYGMGEKGYDDNLVFELVPLNPYGYTKYLFDCWVVQNSLDKTFVGLKFFNVFGPNEYHKEEMASMVYKAYNQAISKGKISLFKSTNPNFSDGEQKRDFIYIKDTLEIIWKIYNSNVAGIYNVGTGAARSWNELAFCVFKCLNLKPNIEYFDMPKDLYSQYQNFTQAKMDKLLSKLGEQKFTSLEDAIDDYINNYLVKDWKYF